MSLSPEDHLALEAAVSRLERPHLAARLVALGGLPAAAVGRVLPPAASALVTRAAGLALDRALDIALYSLRDRRFGGGRVLHSALASASGAIGGAFGFAAITVELPVSTVIMLRAIATIADAAGEDLGDPQTGLACLEVFALGGAGSSGGQPSEYFAVRSLLVRTLAGAADALVGKSALREGTPALLRFAAQVAGRFGLVVSEKVAAQAVPVIGALGGAAVNLAFIEHFQEIACGHFAVRRLERAYGAAEVRAEYDRLAAAA